MDAYIEGRRRSTVLQILDCNNNKDALRALLRSRITLADIYRDDGAILTAKSIRENDCKLIEDALNEI